MASAFRGSLGLLAMVVLATAGWSADEKAKPAAGSSQSTTERETMKPARTLQDLNIPADAILIICEEAKKALEFLPKGILLTPERYQELRRLEDEKGLKRQADLARPSVPSSCTLTGHVEGQVVLLQAQFKIVTTRPKTPVALGCQRAWARSASLDGHLPIFLPDPGRDDGLVVEVESAGSHELTLGLAVPLVPRGAKGRERGFDVGLPRAAITRLESLRFPGGATEVRVNGRTVAARSVDGSLGQVEDVLLGPADRLDFSWQAPIAATDRVRPVLAAEGRIAARLEEKRVLTDVDLSLQVLRGETSQWQILLPPEATLEIKEPSPQDDRIDHMEVPSAGEPKLTIRLKKPSAAPLRVVFQVSQSRTDARLGIGPFLVVGALRQHGTIAVSAPPEYRLSFHPDRDVSRREPSEDTAREDPVAVFNYWRLSTAAPPSQTIPPLLGVDVQTVKGAVESKVEHTVQLTESGWKVSSRLDITPVRTGVEALELQVAADYLDRAAGAFPADLIDDQPIFDARRQVLVVKLASRQFRPFSVTLPAVYPSSSTIQSFQAELPRPLQTLDRGGQLTVILPEGQELVARTVGGDALPPGTRKFTWTWDRAPARAEFGWRPYRPELRVESVLDVTLRERQATAQLRIHLHFPEAPAARVHLRSPASLEEHLRVVEGGSLGPAGVVMLERPDKNATLLLAYPLPAAEDIRASAPSAARGKGDAGRLLSVPIVRVAEATRSETKVRVWGETPSRVTVAEGSWDEIPCEAVPEQDSLPLLVLRTGRANNPLSLRLVETPGTLVAPIMIERALFQSAVTDDGDQHCRARLLLGRLGTDAIEVEFPDAVASLHVDAWLDGKRLFRSRIVDSSGQESESGTVLRLEIEPELYHKPVVLDLTYQLSAGRLNGSSTFQSVFYSPVLRGDVFLGKARWEVEMPAGWISFCRSGGYRPEQTWAWRGGLLTPVPSVTRADLEAWFTGTGPVPGRTAQPEDKVSGVVCWQSHLEPLPVVHFPRQAWLLVCSLLFLAVGLALCFAWLSRGVFILLLAGLGLTLLAFAVGWPGGVPVVIYGCEPGAVVLALTLVAHGAFQYHHHRRRRFLPGFTRTKPATSLTQPTSSLRQRIEPSTVDAPAPRDSSLSKKQPVQEP